MEAEGSSGAPSFKQIVLQKQNNERKEGVRITGLDNSIQPGSGDRGQSQGNTDKKKETTKGTGPETDNLTGAKNKTPVINNSSENRKRQGQDERKQTGNRQSRPEKEGEPSSNPNTIS